MKQTPLNTKKPNTGLCLPRTKNYSQIHHFDVLEQEKMEIELELYQQNFPMKIQTQQLRAPLPRLPEEGAHQNSEAINQEGIPPTKRHTLPGSLLTRASSSALPKT
jgi:hypothetical protein